MPNDLDHREYEFTKQSQGDVDKSKPHRVPGIDKTLQQ